MVKSEVIDEFVQAIQQPETDSNKTYSAIVSRVDGEGVVWVNLVGSDKETPTASTSAEVKSGDNVTVNWRNNKLYIEGNYSNPSAGVERVRYVEGVASDADLKADTAQESANNARRVADNAQKIAGDTNQYFWFTEEGTDTGAHITEVPQDEWNDSTSENYHSGGNLLARSNGIAVRDGLDELAQFGRTTIIGRNGESSIQISSDALVGYGESGSEVFNFASSGANVRTWVTQIIATDVPFPDIPAPTSNGYSATLNYTPIDTIQARIELYRTSNGASYKDVYVSFDMGTEMTMSALFNFGGVQYELSAYYDGVETITNFGISSDTAKTDALYASKVYIKYLTNLAAPCYEIGGGLEVTGAYSIAEGFGNEVSGNYAHAEGYSNTVSSNYAHAEGWNTEATGIRAHAEGMMTHATKDSAHAEGMMTRATGDASHAEGSNAYATGDYSHAEGFGPTASGKYSHAQNNQTIAQRKSQTVLGEYNTADTGGTNESTRGDYAVIVGNGTGASARSNALTVDWNGNTKQEGGITTYNHSSAVGSIVYGFLSADLSVPNNTYTKIMDISLTAGVWVVVAGLRWASNATGNRRMNIATTSGGNDQQLSVSAVSGTSTQMVFTRILSFDSTTTIYLNGCQSSGVALNANAGGNNWGTYITAVRIA